MNDRLLLLWSQRFKSFVAPIEKDLRDDDVVVEVPDNIDATTIDQVAMAITSEIRDALTGCQDRQLRIALAGPPVIEGILDHVLDNIADPIGASVIVIKRKKGNDKAPSIVLDQCSLSSIINERKKEE